MFASHSTASILPSCGGSSFRSTNSLKTLHLAIQAAMLFENYRLFRFDVGKASYDIRVDDDYMGPPSSDAGNLRLAKLVERGITDFTDTDDFGATGGTAS